MRNSGRFGCLVIGTLLTAVSTSYGAPLTWTGGAGAGNQEWSKGANFSPSGPPTSVDDVTFDKTTSGGSPGVLTNIVDSSFTIHNLIYTTAVGAGNAYHTTQINSGAVLTITGDFTQGLGNPPLDTPGEGAGAGTNVTIAGPGSLVFNNSGGNFRMGNFSGLYDRGTRKDVLDLSGLASFTMNANVWEVGRVGSAPPSLAATMTLADTNHITATKLDMGEWNDYAFLELGRVNVLNIDTFELGYNATNDAHGTIRFDAGLSNPSVVIRNRAGTGPANLLMGRSQSYGEVSGDLDLTGGYVDAQFDQVAMGFGRPDRYVAPGNGTITFNQGAISANTVLLAQVRGGGPANGTININGTAVFSAGTITMGDVIDNNGDGYTGTATARISLGGGTLRARTIQPGAKLGDVAQPHVREIAFSSGRIQNLAGGGLTIDPAISVLLSTTGTHSVYADAGQTIAINGVISQTAPGTSGLTIDGPGTVLLNAANSYTGTTTVLAGATLGGKGSIAGAVGLYGDLSPGASVGTFSTGSQTWFAGGQFTFEIDDATGTAGQAGGPGWDLLEIAGDLNLGNLGSREFEVDIVSLQPGGGTVPGMANHFSAGPLQFYAWDFVHVTGDILGFQQGDFVLDHSGFQNPITSGVGEGAFGIRLNPLNPDYLQITFTAAPEPSTVMLCASGLLALALAGWRRRR